MWLSRIRSRMEILLLQCAMHVGTSARAEQYGATRPSRGTTGTPELRTIRAASRFGRYVP